MDLIKRLEEYENYKSDEIYIEKIGSKKVMLTAPHTMLQRKKDDKDKVREPYTKAIAMLISEKLDTSYLIKIKDTGVDSNREVKEEFKDELKRVIDKENIILSIDLHGAKKSREFAVEFGTLDGISMSKENFDLLINIFNKNGIDQIKVNDPFKGGAITKMVTEETSAEALQIEINTIYRDLSIPENITKLVNAISEFIEKYIEINYK